MNPHRTVSSHIWLHNNVTLGIQPLSCHTYTKCIHTYAHTHAHTYHNSTQDLVIMYNIINSYTVVVHHQGEGGRLDIMVAAVWVLPVSSRDTGGCRVASKLAVTRIVEDTVPRIGVGRRPQQRHCLTLWAALHNC